MPYNPKHTLSAIIQQSDNLSKLLDKAHNLEILTKLVQKALLSLENTQNGQPNLSQQCFVGAFENGVLRLLTSAPVWEHELRFLTCDLQNKLKRHPLFKSLTQIKTRVKESVYRPDYPPVLGKPVLSKQNAQGLLELAGNLTLKSGNLKKALEKLSKQAQH